MQPTRPTHFFPESVRLFVRKRFQESLGLGVICLSLFTWLSCITHDHSDGSLNVVSTYDKINNLFAAPGAYYADFALQYFGHASYLLSLVLMIWGYLLFSHQPLTNLKTRIISLIASIVLANLSISAFLSYIGGDADGVIGYTLLQSLAQSLNHIGIESILLIISGGLFLGCCFTIYYAAGLSIQSWLAMGSRIWNFSTLVTKFLWSAIRKAKTFLSLKPIVTPSRTDEPVLHQSENEDQGFSVNYDIGEPVSLEDRDEHDQEDAQALVLNAEIYEEGEMVSGHHMKPAPSSSSLTQQPSASTPTKTTPKSNRPVKKPASGETLSLGEKGLYTLPDLSLLQDPGVISQKKLTRQELEDNIENLSQVLADYGVKGKIVGAKPGPVVTLYELEPAPGIKSSRIIGLADDIARSMHAVSARIAVVPGKNIIGIELPNDVRQTVYLQDLLASKDFDNNNAKLNLALGKNISGSPILTDLARMPHMIVAGTTGSGKSVGINAMILSLLYRHSPETCRLILIDPKMLEFSMYNDIPHLLTPVVTEPNKAVFALKWAVREMENRYRGMSHLGVRNIENYNAAIKQALKDGREITRTVQTGFDPETGRPIFEDQPISMKPLPYIVIVVDEMADLMMVAGKDIESAVQRLAQMARAAGIHLIMATQRPSVDVITGTIKANFPTRISFQVTSKFDSRTILGEQGAEQLLGRGDMLFMEAGGRIQRIHGPFVSDEEVERIVTFLKSQGAPEYVSNVCDESSDLGMDTGASAEEGDELYQKAVAIVRADRKASTSYIQRRLQIGYNRAARIIEQMESAGVISSANHVGKREVLLDEA